MPGNYLVARLFAAVPVRLRESFDGRSRHQERLENSVFHQGNAAGLHALIVVAIRSVQVHAYYVFLRRVEHNGQKFGQNLAINALGERLTVCFITLAVATPLFKRTL